MTDILASSSTDVTHEGQLTLSPVAQRLQRIGHEILDGGGLTLVEENVFSTCPTPIESFTERLLRARDTAIPLVEVVLIGAEAGYQHVNRAFSVNGRIIQGVMHATGIEQTSRRHGVAQLEYKAVGLSMLRPEEMLRIIHEDRRLETFAEFGSFVGYDGGLTDGWGLPKESFVSSSYFHEDGTILDLADSSPMYSILDQALVDLQRALFAESAVTGSAEEVVDQVQLDRGIAGYLDA